MPRYVVLLSKVEMEGVRKVSSYGLRAFYFYSCLV